MEEQNDLPSGSFVFIDGSTYDGEYTDIDDVRMRLGHGTFADGPDVYVGEWDKDVMNGEGKYTYASGAWYNGEFVDGKMEGKGKYKWADGSSYTGGWRENKMHGEGKYVDNEGVTWTGRFHNGMFFNGKSYITLR